MKITLSKRILALIIAVLIVVAAFDTYMIVSMQSQFQADDSVFSYVVFPDGSSFKAKNQASGLVDFASSNASTVIVQAVTAGNYVYIKAGDYPLTSDLEILNKNNVRIVSDGANVIGNGYSIIIKGDNYTTSQYNQISGLNVVNGTLRVENSFATTISDMTFENSTTALELANTDTWTEGTKIDNIHFINCVEAIAFRTPVGNSTGSYGSTEITRCFFNQKDNSIGVNVEQKAEFSDSQILNSRLWLGENGEKTNQTGLLVDGAMFQTLLSGVIFESFADAPQTMYAVRVGENADPAPILDDGISFLGNWTARIYNPFNKWVSGVGTVFKRTENVPLGVNSQYGEIVNIHARPLTISSFKPKITVQGNVAADEEVTVRIRLEFVDNVISQSVEKTFTNATSVWLTDDDVLRLLPSQDVIWAILADAKSSSGSTSASATVVIYGMAT